MLTLRVVERVILMGGVTLASLTGVVGEQVVFQGAVQCRGACRARLRNAMRPYTYRDVAESPRRERRQCDDSGEGDLQGGEIVIIGTIIVCPEHGS